MPPRVGVEDEGGPVSARLREPGAGESGDGGGQGLRIVAALAAAWGVTRDVISRAVWFRVAWNDR